jgi:beta-mannosidase
MLRVGGTMVYESETFYRLCDELGILVWQDFMFANMDYPFGDGEFRAEVDAEVRHQLGRLHRHPCIAAYCGGSEVAQQAAMMGLGPEHWSNEFVARELPRLCAELHSGVPYFPSSPWGGALPFHVGTGIAHYYGVGAYRRPLADVKAARVKFASECLGFSNVPEAATIERMLDGARPAPHHPRWKARVPRDNGAGYDFEDVRDHYLKLLFGADAVELRSQDLERYYAASRVVTGEAMARVFSEWRAPASGCGGALVWFFRDLWAGAGWGLTDELGLPKAAYWYLKRAWAPQTVRITDEGLDGLLLHVVNEAAAPLEAQVELEMMQAGRLVAAAPRKAVDVPARGAVTLQGDALLGYFSDSNDSYRFGPPKYDAIAARLTRRDTGEVLGEDFHFPLGLDLPIQRSAGLEASARWTRDAAVVMRVRSEVFLQAVSIACDGFAPDDNHFHLVPKREKRIVLARTAGPTVEFRAHLQALNLAEGIGVRAAPMDADEAR